jgi:hypothetical protein
LNGQLRLLLVDPADPDDLADPDDRAPLDVASENKTPVILRGYGFDVNLVAARRLS